MRDITVRRLSQLHAMLYRATKGRLGKRLAGNDMLLLTTSGRTSGESHTVPLLYLEDGENLVVIASFGGRDYHPDWYLNLIDQPAATVRVRGWGRSVIARTANPEERAIWWERVREAYRDYEVYQGRTAREIPVVFLEPNN